ncbi:MAG TPA: isoprenylcysteine carboxylmethyltransferase family protein [Candidatus Limnocylindrales bacterium]
MGKLIPHAIGSAVFFVLAPGTRLRHATCGRVSAASGQRPPPAGLVPWWLSDGFTSRAAWGRIPGAILFLGGLAVLVHSFVRFVLKEGTPAPVAPTKHLVVEGFYRYVRNPMYVAITAIVLGEALWLAQPPLFIYAAVTWVIPALFVKFYEEPVLTQQFGDEYLTYKKNVPAWIPRITPFVPSGQGSHRIPE